jgi:hypothetical protein
MTHKKMRFYLKTSERMYGLKPGRMVKSFPGNVILDNLAITPIFYDLELF